MSAPEQHRFHTPPRPDQALAVILYFSAPAGNFLPAFRSCRQFADLSAICNISTFHPLWLAAKLIHQWMVAHFSDNAFRPCDDLQISPLLCPARRKDGAMITPPECVTRSTISRHTKEPGMTELAVRRSPELDFKEYL
jgi:hypothetical protein